MKNKKIMIPIILIVVILILCTVAYLYLKTDTFKTNKQLFYKYLLSNYSQQIDQGKVNSLNEKLKSLNYSSSGEIKLSYGENAGTAGIANLQEIFNIAYQSNKNNQTKQDKTAIDFKLNNQSFVKANYLRSDNTYGLSLDNVTNKYLAVENANLKQLFSKLGVTDVSEIPDSIPQINLEDLLKIDEATLNSLKITYMAVMDNNINNDKYIKTKNEDGTKTISLSLTDAELLNLVKSILETAKGDNTTINLIINKANSLGISITSETIVAKIQEIIDDLQDTQIQNIEALKIEITENGKTATDLKFTINSGMNITVITTTFNDNQINTNIMTTSSNNNNTENINIVTTIQDDGNNLKYLMNIDSNSTSNLGNTEKMAINAQIQINNYHSEQVTNICLINVSSDDATMELNTSETITFTNDLPIEQLTTSNSVKLNDMSSEELINLFNSLQKRIVALYGNQIASMSMGYSALQRAQSAADKMEKNLEKEQQAVEAYEREMNQLQQR